jgi:16S rRNA (uracil1498-N3)-methyltransferase
MTDKIKTRLFVKDPLGPNASFELVEGQAHYLIHTLRAKPGDDVALFNGMDGEWRAKVQLVGKRSIQLVAEELIAPQVNAPDVWLLFAPVKNEKIDYTVKRCTELGVSVLQPVMTHRTIVSRVNMERLEANAVEAAEQSGRTEVPEVREPAPLTTLLGAWPHERTLLFCDEGGAGKSLREALPSFKKAPYALLIGPEGGFTEAERSMLLALPYVKALSLGPRILRAETAALAALANVQAWVGDW